MHSSNSGKVAVLLMSVGSPRNGKEVEKYVDELRKERRLTRQLVAGLLKDSRGIATVARAVRRPTAVQMAALKRKYKRIGFSPLLAITERQARALKAKLSTKGITADVYPAMKRLHPSIREVVTRMKNRGYGTVIGIVMFPSYSVVFNDAYEMLLKSEMRKQGLRCNLTVIKSWDENKNFLEAWRENISHEYARLDRKRTLVIFTTHSIPKVFVDGGDNYIKNFEKAAKRLATSTMLQNWKCGYYTGGHPSPVQDIRQVIYEAKADGYSNILSVPLGFVTENMETLYGLGIECAEAADKAGIGITRMHPLNDSEKLIDALADLVMKGLNNK